jgi:hypothetical protein
MLGTYVYHEIIRKTIVGFGTLFNDIEIRRSGEGGRIEAMKVPLSYGPKQKFLARLEQQTNQEQPVQMVLPRMSFEIKNISYDASRKVSPIQTIKSVADSDSKVRRAYMPVPYNLDFELAIIAKNSDDAVQIVEQILPYFQPTFNITINLVDAIGEKKDIPITLSSISYEDDYEGDYMKRRAIIYTLTFTTKTYLYGPVSDSSVIKKAIADVYTKVDTVSTPRAIRYTAQPDPVTAEVTDDFGFTETWTTNNDYVQWNPVTGQDESI